MSTSLIFRCIARNSAPKMETPAPQEDRNPALRYRAAGESDSGRINMLRNSEN